jgi:hypothetical protein
MTSHALIGQGKIRQRPAECKMEALSESLFTVRV